MSESLDISVIIPVYNAGDALHFCLDSLIEQTIGTSRFEVILVDDCSTDVSGAICDEYAQRYSFIHVLHREANSGGPCEPRNDGLRLARGEYVLFADADDWFGMEALERLYNHAIEWDSEYVLGRVVKVENGEAVPWIALFRKNTGNLINLNIRDNYEICASWGPWSRLIKKSVLLDNSICFDVSLTYFEDQIWNLQVLEVAKRPCIANDYDYYFVRRDDNLLSLTTPGVFGEHKRPEVLCKAVDKILSIIEADEKNLNETCAFWKKFFVFAFWDAFVIIDESGRCNPELYPDNGKKYKDIIWDRIKPYYSATLRETLVLEHTCWFDAVAAGRGYDYDETFLCYTRKPIRNKKCLEIIRQGRFADIEINKRLDYLSLEARKRLFAIQATNYEAYADYLQDRAEGVISGELHAPLYITNAFSFQLQIDAPAQKIVLAPDQLVIKPYSWGEEYEWRAKWYAELPEGLNLPIQTDSLTLAVFLQGQKVFEIPVNPWDTENGRPKAKGLPSNSKRATVLLQDLKVDYQKQGEELEELRQVHESESMQLSRKLEEAQRELDSAQRELDSIKNSRSWKYTRFMRAALGHNKFE